MTQVFVQPKVGAQSVQAVTRTATLRLDTHFVVAPVDRNLFASFIEHMGRAVYEGIYQPDSPHADERGFRRDVIEAIRPLNVPLVRYPGGNFVSNYNWKDGIGPRTQRPTRLDYAWRSLETNQFGTDEFMDWCKLTNIAPMMAINLGLGSVEEGMHLVEYCNHPGGTYWSDKRIANGHRDPHNVKYWCLGNEMDGNWQIGHVPAEVYAQRTLQMAHLIHNYDPSLKTIVCGSSVQGKPWYLNWDRIVLEHCWDHFDYISAHRYAGNWDGNSANFLAEGVEVDRIIEEYASTINYVRGYKKNYKNVYVSFDEWNVYYKGRNDNKPAPQFWTSARPIEEEVYNLEDALVCAQFISSFIRHADVVKIACLAQLVNVIAPILTSRDGILVQSIYYPFEMYSRCARGLSLRTVLNSPTHETKGYRGEVPTIDAAATVDPETGVVSLFLVNRHLTDAIELQMRIDDRYITNVASAELLTHDSLQAANTWDNPRHVAPTTATVTIPAPDALVTTLPPHSLTVVQLNTMPR